MGKTINKTQIKPYWQERAERNFIAGEKKALQVARELKSLYMKADKAIDDKINIFYGKYANETGLNLEDARTLLNKNELKDFKSYIVEMLKMGNKNNFSQEEMYEFRRLYNKAKITRLEELQTNIRAELDKLAAETEDSVSALLADSYENEYYKAIYDIQTDFDINKAFTGLNKQAIEKAINQKYLRSNYKARIWDNNSRVLNKIITQLIPRGIVLGGSAKSLAREITSKKVNKELYNSTVRLIRTEYSHILNQAALDGYKAAGIHQFKILTTLDDRRCDDCAEFEGKIIDIDEAIEGVDIPPFHPNCRCTTVPTSERYEAVIEDKELEGKPIEWMSAEKLYDKWRKGLIKLEGNKVIYKGGE